MQPLLGKVLLPLYGGIPSVWNACLVFFQTALLAGYAYAHLLQSKLSLRQGARVHSALLVLSAALLPLAPGPHWRSESSQPNELNIFWLLASRIGPLFILLASTGPLMQSWLVKMRPGYKPYRLFALSNAGSLAALLLYPFALEPSLTRAAQATIWSLSYGVFALLAIGCAWMVSKTAEDKLSIATKAETASLDARPALAIRLLWIALAAIPSLLLLAITNHLCQELPSFPFLWVLPLCLYLLTFILCFDSERFYQRPVFLVGITLAMVGCCFLLRISTDTPAWWTIGGWSAVLFLCAMTCHGELASRKPEPQFVSSFYLAIAMGGALGGLFGGLAAPRLFLGYFELHSALFLCPAIVFWSYWSDPKSELFGGKPRHVWGLLFLGLGFLGFDLGNRVSDFFANTTFQSRDFFGVIRIFEVRSDEPKERYEIIAHGAINHGYQCMEPEVKRRIAMGYYGKESGVHEAFRLAATANRPLRVGAVGLGAGTVAAYGREGDVIRFYEISPAMVALAQERFYYLRDSKAKCEIVLGDARLSMEKEEAQNYDILVLDAFNSDSIPAHLLTEESFAIYRKHLRPEGILAVHVSNKFLDLEPLVRTLGKKWGFEAAFLDCPQDLRIGTMESDWGLLCAVPERLTALLEKDRARGKPEKPIKGPPWTDDFGSLFQVLK